MMLGELAQNQREAERYVDESADNFSRMQRDIEQAGLQKGISEKEITSKYGEPIFCRTTLEKEGEVRCLYRHPIRFFNTDEVYLYFDNSKMLDCWESSHPVQ